MGLNWRAFEEEPVLLLSGVSPARGRGLGMTGKGSTAVVARNTIPLVETYQVDLSILGPNY